MSTMEHMCYFSHVSQCDPCSILDNSDITYFLMSTLFFIWYFSIIQTKYFNQISPLLSGNCLLFTSWTWLRFSVSERLVFPPLSEVVWTVTLPVSGVSVVLVQSSCILNVSGLSMRLDCDLFLLPAWSLGCKFLLLRANSRSHFEPLGGRMWILIAG